MKRLLFALLLTLIASVTAAQDAAPITLAPFAEPTYGISGVAPKDWEIYTNGLWLRREPTQALLAQQGIIGGFNDIVGELLAQLGLSALPDPEDGVTTDALDWVLYSIDGPEGSNLVVDFAISTKDASVYLILLQSDADERATLRETVFLPAVNALAPLDASMMLPEDATYSAENVTFANGDILLAGTLTLPEGDGPHPAVIMVTGSGPQDRNETLSGLSLAPFAVIADHLARNGIATLRYDDRGYGRSSGTYDSATTTDFATDAAAALTYLQTRPEIDDAQIGVLGHSEGGVVASHLVTDSAPVAFYILLAAPAVDGTELLIRQNERLYAAELQANTRDETWSPAALEAQLTFISAMFPLVLNQDQFGMAELLDSRVREQVAALSAEQLAQVSDLETFIQTAVIAQLTDFQRAWWPDFLRYDPAPAWETVTVPVLAIYGGRDVQVDAEQNATALRVALEASPAAGSFAITTLENANHLFQYAMTGAVSEYTILQPRFDAELLPTLSDWLLAQVTLP